MNLFNPCPQTLEPPPLRVSKSGAQQFRDCILALKNRGLSNLQIAEQLGMSKSAVAIWISHPHASAGQEVISIAYNHFNIDPFSWPKKRSGVK